jgi:cellulose synthase/poly-beta-1,6-N-acetylglucosamine synthase-like glycosyltransferase
MALCFAIVLIGLALLLWIPVGVLLAEVVLAVTGSRRGAGSDAVPPEPTSAEQAPSQPRPCVAVLIPAHDEATTITPTLRAIVPQLKSTDRLLVVADNCSDETAAVARAEGAEAIERNDLTLRGKGYALSYGLRHLESGSPQVVIIIDADCHVAESAIDRLARECVRTGRPVQALYLVYAQNSSGPRARFAQFAQTLKNLVRASGLHRVGLPCQLAGSGMAFPWSCIRRSQFATGHIVEDLKLGLDLAWSGTPPRFCPQALVTSPFPSSDEGLRSQRTRWEHGHLSVIVSETPRLLLRALMKRDRALLAFALDLSVPPLSLLLLLSVVLWLASLALYAGTDEPYPLELTSAAILALAASVLLSWARYGRDILSVGSIALAPLYVIWKIPVYVRFLVARQLEWVRSKRDGEAL